MSVRDGRKAPFVWASCATLSYLREHWSEDAGTRTGPGLAVYHALTELANEDYARTDTQAGSSGEFSTSRSRICERAGLSDKPVDKALRELERIGLLGVRRNNEGDGKRAGAVSTYVLYEPGQTCGQAPQVEGSEPADRLRRTPGLAPQVADKPADRLRTPPNNRRRKQPKKKESAPTAEADFGVLLATIGAPLRQVAEAKGANFNAESIKRACDAFPDRDHAEQAERFAAWHLPGGDGENAPLRVVAVGFKKWLRTSPAARRDRGAVRPSAPVEPVPPLELLRERASEVEAAWAVVAEHLRQQMSESNFQLWLGQLEPIGRDESTVYFAAREDVRAWVERRYTALIAEALGAELGVVRVRVVAAFDTGAELA